MVDLAVDAGLEDITERYPTYTHHAPGFELPRYNRVEFRAVGHVCSSVAKGLQFGSGTAGGGNCEVDGSVL